MLIRGGLLLDPAVTGEIALTLLHFLWQGVVLALLLWIVLKLPRQSPRVRYAAAGATLVLMILAPVATYWSVHGTFDDPGPLTLPAGLVPMSGAGPTIRVHVREATRPLERRAPATMPAVAGLDDKSRFDLPPAWSLQLQRAIPWIVLIWLGFAMLLALRQLAALLLLHWALNRNTAPLRPQGERLQALPRRLGIRRSVGFYECSLLEVPATVGWLRPIVLIPAAALDLLWPRQLDALVAHELAHIRRYDYLMNLLQSVLEAVLAFHPAVWWVSARVREERENCCDELAAEVVGSRKEYAATLKTLEELRPSMHPSSPALSAAGGPLLRRIQRLAVSASDPFGTRSSGVALAAVLAPLVSAGVLFLAASQLVATSVNVEPPRGLHDVPSLSVAVYSALGMLDPATDVRPAGLTPLPDDGLLAHFKRAIDSSRDRGKQFDRQAVEALVEVVLHTPQPMVLGSVQLSLTDVEQRIGFERRPEWRYGSTQLRLRLNQYLLRLARAAATTEPHAAQRYARAALLLAAQDAALHNTLPLGQVLRDKSIARLAGLSSWEAARIHRALQDHRVILRVATLEMKHALYAMRALAAHRAGQIALEPADAVAMRAQLGDAIDAMLRISRGRPDTEWTVANLCWRARAVLEDSEAAQLRVRLAASPYVQTPHLERWIDQAFADPDVEPFYEPALSVESDRMRWTLMETLGLRSPRRPGVNK